MCLIIWQIFQIMYSMVYFVSYLFKLFRLLISYMQKINIFLGILLLLLFVFFLNNIWFCIQSGNFYCLHAQIFTICIGWILIKQSISLSVRKLDILFYTTVVYLPAFPKSLLKSFHFGIILSIWEAIPYNSIEFSERNSFPISIGFTPSSSTGNHVVVRCHSY